VVAIEWLPDHQLQQQHQRQTPSLLLLLLLLLLGLAVPAWLHRWQVMPAAAHGV
jgi:hypothetical protein